MKFSENLFDLMWGWDRGGLISLLGVVRKREELGVGVGVMLRGIGGG